MIENVSEIPVYGGKELILLVTDEPLPRTGHLVFRLSPDPQAKSPIVGPQANGFRVLFSKDGSEVQPENVQLKSGDPRFLFVPCDQDPSWWHVGNLFPGDDGIVIPFSVAAEIEGKHYFIKDPQVLAINISLPDYCP